MADLQFLWKHRAKFPFGSKFFFKAWAKRFLTFPELTKRNFRRTKLVWSGATIDISSEIGDVSIKGPKRKLTIGQFSFLGRVKIALHDEVVIGNNVCINDGVEILTASHGINDTHWELIKKKVIIDDFVWIASGALILPGVHIGRGAVIGARAVVSKSVGPGNIVVGNPASPIPKTRIEELKYNPCDFLAANRSWLVG